MPEEFQEFLTYFEKTYVGMPKIVSQPGETIRLGWKDAKFAPSTWSVYERSIRGVIWTLLTCDSYHLMINRP